MFSAGSDFDAWLSGLEPPKAAPEAQPLAVPDSAEFRRIRDAERVDWRADPRLSAGALALSAALRTPSGTQTLREVQAAILSDLYNRGRTFVPLRTAGGKTLPGFLAAEVLQAKRPLLIVPAKLLNSGKTHREHAKYRQHWRLRPIMSVKESRARRLVQSAFAPFRVVSYELLSHIDYEKALENWNPDLVVADECHKFKDPKSAMTRRTGRFIRTFAPKLLLMSGSVVNRSIAEIVHLLRWCFGDAAPIPRDWNELMLWRWALDEKVPDGVRVDPGALLDLSPPDPEDNGSDIQIARRRFSRRLRSTAGVIAAGDRLPEVVLTCSTVRIEPDKEQREVVAHLRKHWETPCGHPFEMATDLWRHEREVSCGFYYRWDERPPPQWLIARREWSAYVREILAHSRTYDSPMSVAQAIDRGKLDDSGVLEAWRRVAHMFDPEEHKEPVWVSDQTVELCAGWLEEERGICWVSHVAFGERLSKVSGVPYFAAGGKCGKVAIDQHNGPAIASIKAVNEGFNLHTLHHKNFVSTCPTTNRENEQMISRTHRDDQPEDVEFTYRICLDGDERALNQAIADAEAAEALIGLPQRLTAATWL